MEICILRNDEVNLSDEEHNTVWNDESKNGDAHLYIWYVGAT